MIQLYLYISVSSVQSLSHVGLFETPCTPGFLSITNSQSSLKLMSIELVMPSNHLILCCPLPLLPSIFPSIRYVYIYLHIDIWIVKKLVTQSCPALCDPMDCKSPGFSIRGIFQARILEWVALPFFRGSSWPRDWTLVFCIKVDSLPSEPCGKLYISPIYIFIYILFKIPLHSRLSQDTEYSTLCYTVAYITLEAEFLHSQKTLLLPWKYSADYMRSTYINLLYLKPSDHRY